MKKNIKENNVKLLVIGIILHCTKKVLQISKLTRYVSSILIAQTTSFHLFSVKFEQTTI